MKARAVRVSIVLCCLCLIFVLTGCTANVLNNTSGGSSTGNSGGTDRTRSAQEMKVDEQVFPKDKVVDVKITIDEADFQDMLDNAAQEEYKTASVTYNGLVYDNVAVRTKGNLSLNSVVSSDSDRYSFKLAFDEYISSQNIFGVSKINLNNGFSDASYMREFLAYELAESMGLPTPKYSYVNVYVNDELWGFYLAVEQIGTAYLDRYFDTDYGLLYKVIQGTGGDLTLLDSINDYTAIELKSDANPGDEQQLLDMITELNTGDDYAKYIDVDEALKFIALNVAANNMDSYLGMNKHNYYMYEDNGVFSFLPWDYNMAFGGMSNMGFGGGGGGRGGMGGQAFGGGMNADADANAGANADAGAGAGTSSILIDEPTQGVVSERPLVDKLLQVEAYKDRYHEILQEVIDGYLSDVAFSARVAEVSALISEYVKRDPNPFYTYEQYEAGMTSLIATNAAQITSISQQLDGTIPSSGDGSGSGGGFGGGFPGGDFGGEGFPDGAFPGGDFGGEGFPDGAFPGGDFGGQLPNFGGAGAQQGGNMPDFQPGANVEGMQGRPVMPGGIQQGGQAGFPGGVVGDANVEGMQGRPVIPDGAQQGGQGGFPGGVVGDANVEGMRERPARPDGEQQGGQGGFPGGGQGEFGGGRGGGGFPGGGMGGGPNGFGNMAGPAAQAIQTNDPQTEMLSTAIALGILVLACFFILFYKRRRL